jgi:ribosomal protein S21
LWPQVQVNDAQPFDSALRRFQREVKLKGLVYQVQTKKFHEDRQDLKKRKARERGLRKQR